MIKSCLGCKHELDNITAEPCFSCVRGLNVLEQAVNDHYKERDDNNEDCKQ